MSWSSYCTLCIICGHFKISVVVHAATTHNNWRQNNGHTQKHKKREREKKKHKRIIEIIINLNGYECDAQRR